MDNATVRLLQLSHKHPILVYDGVCVLCHRSIRLLMRIDKARKLRYCTLQSHMPGQSYDTVMLFYKGNQFEKSEVWRQLMNILGGFCWLFKPIFFIPKKVLDRLYVFIAVRRFEWFGKLDTCPMPDEKHQALFILL